MLTDERLCLCNHSESDHSGILGVCSHPGCRCDAFEEDPITDPEDLER